MTMLKEVQIAKAKAEKQSIKCVVWDLDNTLWEGILLEDDNVIVRDGVVETIQELDRRGILNSIASRNDYDTAVQKVEALGLSEYFLYPEINWNSKSDSLGAIAKSLNIGLNTFAFVDDQPFERQEVSFVYPEVLCIDAADVHDLLDIPRMMPRFITPESALRRRMYQSDIHRNKIEDEFTGPNEEFLATLDMVFKIKPAEESDLQRAEELTMRTHQLNTTGYTYSYDELNELRQSDDHMLLVTSLDDKYGTYGTIGLALIELGEEAWTIKLLLMSCRVMSRGVGTIMMSYIMSRAKKAGARLRSHFISNNRNRMMLVTYRLGGFKEIEKDGDLVILENDLQQIQPFPDYVQVQVTQSGMTWSRANKSLLGERMKSGNTSDIHQWQDNQIIKLFKEWCTVGSIAREAAINRAIQGSGLPVLAVEDIVEVNGRLGLTFERVEGDSLWDLIDTKTAEELPPFAHLLAELHVQIHTTKIASKLPSQYQKLENKILKAKALPPNVQEAKLNELHQMPKHNDLCHGDFHPDNILLTTQGPIIIDWHDGSQGHSLADVARTSVILGAEATESASASEADTKKQKLKQFMEIYLQRYFELRPNSERNFATWQSITAAARLSENNSVGQDWLLAMANDER